MTEKMKFKNEFANKIIRAFKSISLVFHIIFYAFGISAPIYAIKADFGFLPLHISLICISTVSLTLYIIANRSEDKATADSMMAKRKKLKKLRKYAKRLTRLYMIITTVYAIYFTASGFNIFSLLLLVFMITAFVFDILISALVFKLKKALNNLKNSKPEDIIVYNVGEK